MSRFYLYIGRVYRFAFAGTGPVTAPYSYLVLETDATDAITTESGDPLATE